MRAGPRPNLFGTLYGTTSPPEGLLATLQTRIFGERPGAARLASPVIPGKEGVLGRQMCGRSNQTTTHSQMNAVHGRLTAEGPAGPLPTLIGFGWLSLPFALSVAACSFCPPSFVLEAQQSPLRARTCRWLRPHPIVSEGPHNISPISPSQSQLRAQGGFCGSHQTLPNP